MTDMDKKSFRVTGIKDFVGTAQWGEPVENNLTYYYVATIGEAKRLARNLSEAGIYQSEFGGKRDISLDFGSASVTMTNPNVAVIEQWDDDKQEWFFWNED